MVGNLRDCRAAWFWYGEVEQCSRHLVNAADAQRPIVRHAHFITDAWPNPGRLIVKGIGHDREAKLDRAVVFPFATVA